MQPQRSRNTPNCRAFSRWTLEPPVNGYNSFGEEAGDSLLWDAIRHKADVPEAGKALFTGNRRHISALWNEFRSYIRQAKAYSDAAANVSGSSASLLHYYCNLNLAKAELLVKNPSTVYQQRLGHGLSYSPTRAKSIQGDVLTLASGVFPLLYEARTGRKVSLGAKIPVKRLLLQCREVGWELGEVSFGDVRSLSAMHALVTDQTQAWSLLAAHSYGLTAFTNGREVTAKLFKKAYQEVKAPSGWRDTFAVSRRYTGVPQFFESKKPMQNAAFGGSASKAFDAARVEASAALEPFAEIPFDGEDEVELYPSLYGSKLLLMPGSLARYALMYYVSSLVRYKPSQLDPQTHGGQAWLLDAFTRQAAPRLIHAAHNGITNTATIFYPRGSLRR